MLLFVVVAEYLANYLFLAFRLLGLCSWAETIRVASYNVENYLVMDRIVSGNVKKIIPNLPRKGDVRSVINQTNPDILAIQEIGERVYLDGFGRIKQHKRRQFKYSAWLPLG